jgi:hypothetical protein
MEEVRMEDLLPDFVLPDVRGGQAGTLGLLQRRELLLAICHPPGCEACDQLLDQLAERSLEPSGPDLAVLALFVEPPDQARPGPERPFPCLVDHEGATLKRLAHLAGTREKEPCLIASNRFGVVLSAKKIHDGAPAIELVEDAVGWTDFVQMQCPECGVPTW